MLVVQKYGGTSVGTPERINAVADRIAARRRAGDRVVVVVSAMGQTTDELIRLAEAVTQNPSRRELDMLLTAGERISMALLSMALHARGVDAISFTGSQSGIITTTDHTQARITDVRPIRIGPELERGRVVIVAGFQGVSPEKEVTTLGRGGSDTSAVALACGLGADLCEIYTDVPGVMTADPGLVDRAGLIPGLSWDVMAEMAACGAGVMHTRAVGLARRRRTPFTVRSSFTEEEGTMVGAEFESGKSVAAVTGRPHVLRARIQGDTVPRDFWTGLRALVTDVDGLEWDASGGLRVFAPAGPRAAETAAGIRSLAEKFGLHALVDTDHAAVTLVTSSIADQIGLGVEGSRALMDAGIVAAGVRSGNLSVTFLVPSSSYAEAQRVLHRAFLEEN